MNRLWQDIKVGIRTMLKTPTFTAVAVITIALGVGSTTAIFSIVNTVLVRPLPYRAPENLMTVWGTRPQQGQSQLRTSMPNFKDWQSQNQIFDSLAAYGFNRYILTGVDEPEQIRGAQVSEQFFQVMGVEPQIGRVFSPDQNREPYVVLGDALWRRRFRADPAIVGKAITLNGTNFTVTGVMPPGFDFPGMESVMWTTLTHALSSTPDQATSRGNNGLRVIGRLKQGVSPEQAQAEMSVIASRLQQQYPDTNASLGVSIIPLHTQVIGNVRPALYALLGAVAFVLLIACANVANLLLTRAVVREREFVVRQALGATRMRLVRQMLTESMVLALVGGVLGVVLAVVGVNLLAGLNLDILPRLAEASVDGRVLLFALGVTLLSGIIFGLAPAFQTKVNLNDTLREAGRGTVGASRGRRLRSLLVVVEVALSLVLLISAGLMIRSFLGLLKIEPGFNPDKLLTMQVILPQSRYSGGPQITNYYQQVLERVRALPGVQAVGVSSGLPPIFNQSRNSFQIEGYQPSGAGESLTANYLPISADYFKALGAKLIDGREFAESDNATAPKVVIISQPMAKRFFPDGRVLGRRITFSDKADDWRTVVGVVGDLKYSGSLYSESEDAIYLPNTQAPYGGMFLLVRTVGDPQNLSRDVRNAVWSIDRDVPLAKVRTMEQVLAESVAQPRFYTFLLGVFAVIALILASVGIYGVISYSVAQRRHELGLRIALGAQPRNVLWLVMAQGLKLVLVGVFIGVFVALASVRVINSLLHGVSPTDLTTFVLVPLVLVGVALLACLVPASRATRVDPMIALRDT
jgi:putative ABC transport system permease protein